MMYETETGYYVLADSEGRIFSRAAMGRPGDYRVSDRTDISESFDVTDLEALEDYGRDPYYDEPDNW